MTKHFIAHRRESTTERDKLIHGMYRKIISELGSLASVVSKTYIYPRIREKTKLSIRTISFILNHTREQ